MEMCGKRIHSFCKQLVIVVLNIVLIFNKVPYAWHGGLGGSFVIWRVITLKITNLSV
jgi:hypothetical protein